MNDVTLGQDGLRESQKEEVGVGQEWRRTWWKGRCDSEVIWRWKGEKLKSKASHWLLDLGHRSGSIS